MGNRPCPYLHQLQADWLSMGCEGYYCLAQRGHVKMVSAAEEIAHCEVPDFAACHEYRELEQAVQPASNVE